MIRKWREYLSFNINMVILSKLKIPFSIEAPILKNLDCQVKQLYKMVIIRETILMVILCATGSLMLSSFSSMDTAIMLLSLLYI